MTEYGALHHFGLMFNGKLYGVTNNETTTNYYLYSIDMATGDWTLENSITLEHTPLADGGGVFGRLFISSGTEPVYSMVYQWRDGNIDYFNMALLYISSTDEYNLYSTPDNYYSGATREGSVVATSINNDGRETLLLQLNTSANIYDNGFLVDPTRNLATSLYIVMLDRTDYSYTAYEDIVDLPDTATLYKKDIDTYGSGLIPLNSRTNVLCLATTDEYIYLFDVNGDLAYNFELDTSGTIVYINAIMDDIDDSIYMIVNEGGTKYLWGITVEGEIIKKFDFTIPSTDYYVINADHMNTDQDFVLFTNFIVRPRPGNNKILHHTESMFSRVLNTSKVSKVEISKDSPTIVYNVASGILDTDLYYSYINTLDSFSGIINLGNIYDLRVFDANYSGSGGLDLNYNRYIGYVTDLGVFARAMPSGESIQITLSGSGTPSHIEVANYGINPYMFVTTTSPQLFYQRNPNAIEFINMSTSLPSGAITIIRLDDRL
jgi:hypothetical protein